MNLDTDLTPFTKINTKCIMDVNVKHKIINLLEDNKGENHFCNGNYFLEATPRA